MFTTNYKILKPNGEIEMIGNIKKLFIKGFLRRKEYLKKIYGSLIKFY